MFFEVKCTAVAVGSPYTKGGKGIFWQSPTFCSRFLDIFISKLGKVYSLKGKTAVWRLVNEGFGSQRFIYVRGRKANNSTTYFPFTVGKIFLIVF